MEQKLFTKDFTLVVIGQDMKKGVFVNELKNLLMICWRG